NSGTFRKPQIDSKEKSSHVYYWISLSRNPSPQGRGAIAPRRCGRSVCRRGSVQRAPEDSVLGRGGGMSRSISQADEAESPSEDESISGGERASSDGGSE